MSNDANRPARVYPNRRARARSAAFAVAFASAFAVGGCAKPGPPGGGSPDSIPPEIVRTSPLGGETGVDRSASIEIEFSEEMNRQTVERSLAVAPPLPLRNFRWKGRTLIAEPATALPESTTVVVRVGENAHDYHDVSIENANSFAFSTGDAIDRGIITGSVTARGQPVASAVVWACRIPVVPDSLGVLDPCGYVSGTDADGAFRIANVRPSATPYTVVAFIDRDGDRRYAVAVEAGRILASAAFLATAADSVGGIEIPLADIGEDDEAESEGPGSPGERGEAPPESPEGAKQQNETSPEVPQ